MEWCGMFGYWCDDIDFMECKFERECNECLFCEVIEC